MKSNRIKVVGDGTPGGTMVFINGNDIAKDAARVEIVVEPGKLCRAVITFNDVQLDVSADALDPQP